jgi:hypothetical protein
MIYAKVFTKALTPDWDAVTRKAVNGHFMFERNFMDYHADRFDDHSLLFYDDRVSDDREPIALLPAHRKGGDLISHEGLPFAGLLWTADVRMNAMTECVEALVEHMATHDFSRLFYAPVPAPYKRFHDDEDIYQIERAGAVLAGTKVGCSALIGSNPGISKNRREIVNRGARRGLRFEKRIALADSYRIISTFLEERFQKRPVHTLAELELLTQRFPEEIRCDGVFHEDELVHAMITFHSETCVRAQYTGGTSRGHDLHAQDFAFVSLLEAPEMQGRWFDFGTSMNPETGDLQSKLHWYKETLGGRTSLVRTYMLDLKEN